MSLEQIEGQDGLFEVKKVKICYEVILIECGYIVKDIKNRKYKIIKKEFRKDGKRNKKSNRSRR